MVNSYKELENKRTKMDFYMLVKLLIIKKKEKANYSMKKVSKYSKVNLLMIEWKERVK